MFKAPGILRQVLVRSKLGWIHEDGSGHQSARSLGRAHQRQMPIMKSSHGGHESQAFSFASRTAASRPHFGNCRENSHAAEEEEALGDESTETAAASGAALMGP